LSEGAGHDLGSVMKGRLRLSKHAEQQLRERNIDRQLVWETLENPGQVISAGKNRKIAQSIYEREGGEFLLRVVFSEEAEPEVITAYWTSRISRYWRD